MTTKIFIVCVAIVALIGCFSSKKSTESVTRIPVKFDFSPPSRQVPGASAMTIALIKPVFVTENAEYYVQPFPEMSTSMANDFEELLTAKGFKIRGPFRSRDEMVYNDKQSCDFAFMVEIDLQPNYNRKYKYDAGLGVIIASSYRMSGEITLGGNLVITAMSPQYGEKIWKKNIALDKASFTYSGSVKWTDMPTVANELKEDNEFYNKFSHELELFYNKSLNLAWQQIDVAEMKTIGEQAKKADKRGN